MNWKDCASRLEQYYEGWRFVWPPEGWSQFDCEQGLTISDVWGAVSWIWTWPGDWVLSQEPLRTFFEIQGTSAIGTTASTVLGWFIFLVVIGLLNQN